MLKKQIGVIMYQTSKSKGQELVAQRMVREFIKLGHKACMHACLTISKLTEELDGALTEELIKERGLTDVPSEVRVTLTEPENVLKSWSSGSWRVVATGRRLFVRRGVISRKVIEIPYTNISSIEYMRRYPWKTLIIGSVISLLLFIEPFLRPIFSRAFISRLEQLMRFLLGDAFLQSPFLETFLDIIPIIPLLIAVVAFAIQTRTGFALRGPGISPLYLPRKFREAIAFIRSIQSGQLLKKRKRIIHNRSE